MARVRRYDAEDLGTVVDIWRRSWSAAFPKRRHPLPAAKWRDRFRDEILIRNDVWVVEFEGHIAGFLAINTRSNYIDQLFVDPDFQARGVGSVLMEKAKELSPDRLRLDALQENAIAIRFYGKHGFVPGAKGVNPVNGQPSVTLTWSR